MNTADLIQFLHERVPFDRVEGPQDTEAFQPQSLASADAGAVCFCNQPTPERFAELEARGISLLISAPFDFAFKWGFAVAVTHQFRLAFAWATGRFEPEPTPGVHPTAVIEGKVHPEATVGAFCYVGPGCTVGPKTVLHPRVTLVRDVTIGANCIIHSGATIGADGYSYARGGDNRLEKFRHYGGVIIEDFVDVGPNTNVNCGTLDPTRLKYGTKVDALCHIGHNAQIGPHACIAAGTIMGRSVIKEATWTGLNSTVLPGNDVENYGTVAAHALVTKNVPEHTTVVGVPAKAIDRRRQAGEMW